MHNWEHFGRLPAYLLAATLVASCGGGGGDSLLNITGVSDANVVLDAASAKLSKTGELPVTLKLTDASNNPLSNQVVKLTSTGSVSLSSSTVTTNANGSAGFSVKGNFTGDLTTANNTGTVTASYTDASGAKKTQALNYTIVDVSELQSSYSVEACFVSSASPCALSRILKTTGTEASAKAEFTLYNSTNAATRQPLANQKVTFTLLKAGSATLSKSSAVTDVNGKVSVDVFAATPVIANAVVATTTDKNGVEAISAIGFDVILGNKVSVVAGKTELLSGGDSVDLTALVVNASGQVQANIPVSFSLVNADTEKGTILKNANAVTDESGKAKATLEVTNATGANLSNHTLQVRASIGTGADFFEETINLQVTGTSIDLNTANNSVKIGANPTITAVLKNGKGQAIAGQTLTFTSNEIKDQTGQFLNVTATTDAIGNITFPNSNQSVLVVDKSNNGKAIIKASGLGIDSLLSFDVSERNFDIAFLNNNQVVTEIDIAEGGDIELTLRDDTGAVLPDAMPVTVTTTLGKILPPTVLTKVDGSPNIRRAKIGLQSEFPGSATIRAAMTDSANKQIIATGTIAFVSKIANKLAVQAVTPTLAPNGQTNIVAKVRDLNDNPVKGVTVNFELKNPLGGTLNTSVASTDAKGEAVVTFTAGDNDTGTEKIQVFATVPSEYTGFSGDRVNELNLTVGGRAVFIAIATGNVIQELSTTTYSVPHQVTVTDATGAPIGNQEIKLSVWPVNYYKGFYVFSEALRLWVAQTTAECSNEDANQNGLLDFWENDKVGNALSPLDYPAGEEVNVEDNGDGKLWPGNPVTLSASTVTTDTNGIANFNVLYGQSFASWLRVKLTAKGSVSGTESQSDRIFRLVASSEDLSDDKGTPPGGTLSAYGSANVCSDVN